MSYTVSAAVFKLKVMFSCLWWQACKS